MTTKPAPASRPQPRRPPHFWRQLPSPPPGMQAWAYGGLRVVSHVAGREDGGWAWGIAVTRGAGARPDDRDAARAKAAFGMPDATEGDMEDEHARHFFLAVPV